MNINRINSQKGIAQLVVMAIMAFLVLGIPTATKLVQENQENRSKAASDYTSIGSTVTNIIQDKDCGLVKFEELTQTTDKDKPEILCKSGFVWQYNLIKPTCEGFDCDKLPLSLSKPYYRWYCAIGVDPKLDLTDANVKQQIKDKVVECRSLASTIIQESPKCGPANGQAGNEYPSKEKLCTVGTPSEVSLNRTTMAYTWQCKLGDKKASCLSNSGPNKPQIINGDCGDIKYSQLSKNSPKDKNITLCKSGKLGEFFTVYENPNSTNLTYVWDCLGSNGGSDIQCDVADPNMIIDGICGKVKYDELTVTSDKDKPKLLCQSGFVENFVKTTPKCVMASDCPPSFYSWTCMNVRNGGKGVKCSVKQGSTNKPTPRPITTIKVNPTSLRLKIGQSQNLTYTLNPSNSTDTVKWEASENGMVRIQQIAVKCVVGANTKCIDAPGNKHLQVTGLKAGNVKIKLTTSSNQSAEVTVVITDDSITKVTPTPSPIKPNAYLYFNLLKKDYKIGDTFQLAVLADSGSHEINGITVYGKYDSSKLELISMEKSTSKPFGDIGDCHNLTNKDYGKFNFNFTCYTNSTYEWMKVKGELVKLTFKAKSAGLAKVQFVCNKDSTEPTSTISNSADHRNFTNCDKNINANIIITGGSAVINGACGTVKYSQITAISDKDKPQLLCKSGKLSEFTIAMTNKCACPPNISNCKCPDNNSGDYYTWKCLGSNGGKSVKCSVKDNLISGSGVCGDTTKIVTNTCVSGSPIDLPDTINEYIWECKGPKATQRCIKIKGSDDHLCPPNQFNHWGKCENDLDIGWGCDRDGVCKSGKCDLTTNRCVTQTTSIKIVPSNSQLKVGKSINLTAILAPDSSTDKVSWSSSNFDVASIQIVNVKCQDNIPIPTGRPLTKCIPGMKLQAQVTGKKAGMVKIKARTSSGQTAEATVIVQK